MIALPPYILLIVFGIFMAGFLFFAVVNIVLLARYGARNAFGLTASFLFVAVTLLILFAAWRSTAGIDWTAPVPLFAIQAPTF